MKTIRKILQAIPAIISSNASIFLYLFLFFYLVIWAFITEIIPGLHHLQPSDTTQLILGNYTNVLSALGASLAAGSGLAIHHSLTRMHKNHAAMHDELLGEIKRLHDRLDHLENKHED